jgi:branched-chain amino acid transport system substrate-binding protein
MRGGVVMKKRDLKSLASIMVLALFLGVFFLSKQAIAQEKKEIVIGGTISETGRFASDVKPWPKLMNTWAEMINELGGLWVKSEKKRLPIKFILYDDKSDQATSIKFYERLVTMDKVDFLIGPYTSPLTFAATTVAEKYKIPMVCAEATAGAIYKRGMKWIVGIDQAGHKWSDAYFELVKHEGKAKTVALLAEDQIIFTEVIPGAAENAKKIGLEVVFNEKAASGTSDFSPIITKMKEKNPDICFVGGFIPFNIAFMKQAKELDFNPKEFHFTHFGVSFKEALGKDAEYATGSAYYMPGMKMGNYKFFLELLKRSAVSIAEYPWANDRMWAFDAIQAGVESSESLNPDDLMQALKDVNIMAVAGQLYFDETGQGTNRPIVNQIVGGEYQFCWPSRPGYPPAKHAYPRPKWSEIK